MAAKDGSKRGGKRPGSGRKSSEAKAKVADINAIAAAQLTEWMPDLLENLKVLADGVKGDDGFYLTPPDRQANEYLVNRLLGKPTERKEVTGEDGGAVRHAVTIYLPDNARNPSPGIPAPARPSKRVAGKPG